MRQVLEAALRLPPEERAALAGALEPGEHGRLLVDALAAAPLLVARIDARGVVLAAAGQGLERLGRPSQAGAERTGVVGQTVGQAFGAAPALATAIERALGGAGEPEDVAHGGRIWELRSVRARGSGGEPAGIVAVVSDVTERRRREDEARDAARFLDAVIENIPDMVFVKDARELRFVRFNRAGEDLVGYARSELLGKNDHDFFPPEEAHFFVIQDRAVLAEKRLVDIPEETIHTKDKGTRLLHTKKVPILDEAGRPVYLLGISEDVTEKRAAEDERRRLLGRLQELDRLKARLVANVSHELRTPLTLVLGVLERLLERRGPSDPERRDLEVAARNARVQLRLVEDLLSVARVEVGAIRPSYEECDVAALVRSIASLFERAASDRRISLSVAAPARAQAEVDSPKLERILSNLLANALRFARDGGAIGVSLEADDRTLRLVIQDDGPGIAPEYRERVFEPFFQLEPGVSGGAGLGLAIVRELALLHGGRVSADAAPGGGARFTVELPRRAPAGARVRRAGGAEAPGLVTVAVEPLAASPGAEPTPPPSGHENGSSPADGRPRVLVVEDNPELRRFLAIALGRRFAVRTARGGRHGLEIALESPPDLILTDLMMPEGTGEELIEAVRARRELEDVPVVVLTAKADDELRLRLLRSGAQDYLLKPVSLEELVTRVGHLVSTKRAGDVLRAELALRGRDLDALTRELVRRRRESEQALVAARIAEQAAVEAGRAKQAFLNLVSHELRAPLTSIGIQLERIARDRTHEPSEVQRSGLSRIRAAGERLAHLVDSLLESARLEAGRLRLVAETFDPGTLLADLVDDYRAGAEAKKLALELALPPVSRTFTSDPRVVRVIASNLLDNAIKYTDAGRVTVACSFSPEGGLRIEVRDTGRGIAPEEQVTVFDPFVQTGEPGRKEPGVGLGLSLVKQLTHALGGNVELTSRPGQGSTFAVVLPAASPAAVPAASAS